MLSWHLRGLFNRELSRGILWGCLGGMFSWVLVWGRILCRAVLLMRKFLGELTEVGDWIFMQNYKSLGDLCLPG